MADEKKQLLARQVEQAKQIQPDVTLLTYYKDIKYFLFGTSETLPVLDKKNLPPGGVRAAVQYGMLIPQSKVYIRCRSGGVNKSRTEFTVPNIRATDPDSIAKIDGNIHFLPSDLVRILTGLARVFVKGDGKNTFNKDVLEKFVKDDEDLHWVRLWGQSGLTESAKKDPDTGIERIAEVKFESPNAAYVEALLDAVIDAAVLYEQTYKKINTSEFVPQSDVETASIDLIVPQVLEKYKDSVLNTLKNSKDYQEKIKPILDQNPRLIEETIQQQEKDILDDIKSEIKKNTIDFFRNLFSEQNKKAFADGPLDKPREIYDKQSNTYLLKTRSSDQKTGVLDSDEYKNFETTAVEKLFNNIQNDLTAKYILPLFSIETKDEQTKTETTEETDSGGGELIEEIVFDEPVELETFLKKLKSDTATLVLAKFSDVFSPQYNADFENLRIRLPANYLKPVADALLEQIEKNVSNNFELLEEELSELEEKNLYADGKFNPEILDSDWYKELLAQTVDYIENIPSPDTAYPSFFSYLFEVFITPSLNELLEPEKPDEPQPASEEDLDTAVVPTTLPTTPPTQTVVVETDEINRLTPEQIRSLQYESAWLYNRAVYELFTSKGIKQEDIDPQVLQDLQSNVFNFTASLGESDFNKLFGSASYRQKTLLDFYQKTGYGINKFQSAGELLSVSLKSAINLDSPVLTENIKNTVNGLIMQYGLNQDFYGFDPETKTVTQYSGTNDHDILWFIDNIPTNRLSLIFNIPEGVIGDDSDIILMLREALKNYAQYRASELSLHVQNITFHKGLSQISAEDAEKIKQGDEATISKHIALTSDLRNMSKAHGGETLAGALDEKPDSHRKEIQKQFKTFIPLWNQLTGFEQAEVYRSFDFPIPPEYLTNGKLDRKKLEIAQLQFIPEFIFFDVTKLQKINIILSRQTDETKKAELLEIIAIQDQLIRERELAKLLNEEYERYSDPSEVREISEAAGVDFDDLSYYEKFQTDEEIQEGGSTEFEYSEAGPGRNGLIPRFLDSKAGRKLKKRFGRGLKKKISPAQKTKKVADKAIAAGLSKAASAALNLIPGIGTAASAALLAIKNKKVQEFLSTAILGGLAFLIGRTIWALGSIGGAIGGVVGGVVGFVASGGTMVIPGAIIGANIGEAIIPTRISNFWGVGQSVSPTYIRDVTNITVVGKSTAATAGTATSIETLLSSAAGIGAVAAGGYSLMVVVITLMIVLTIQGAFLIPVPVERLSVGFDPIGGIGLENCDDPGLLSDKLTRNETSDIAGRAFDIVNKLKPGFWCYWNWNPDYDGLNATFTAPSPESPDLFDEIEFAQYPYHCVYRDNFPDGCSGDWRAMGGNALYWCTWLVNHAYQANYSLAARIMADQFRNTPGHIFLPVESVTYEEIQPGDVIFTSTEGRNGNIGHVAIVHDVGPDFIRSVDSNASSRYNEFTVGTDGKVQVDSVPWLGVVGFGRKL